MKKLTKRFLLSMLSLVLTGSLCVSVTGIQAQELDEDSAFEFVVVLQGQSSGSIDTTATTPFDLKNVGILSIGNQTLTASLDMTSEQTGLWWIGLIGLGTIADADFVFGIAPLAGQTARISVDQGIAFALATGGAFSITDVNEDVPMFYTISVNGG